MREKEPGDLAKGPDFHIVGNIPEEEKETIAKILGENASETRFSGNWSDSEIAEVKRREIPKTPEETELITFANEKTNEFLTRFGLRPYNVRPDHVIILPPDLYHDLSYDRSANAIQLEQLFFLNSKDVRRGLIDFGKIVFHELSHLKSYFALRVKKPPDGSEESRDFSRWRGGLEVFPNKDSVKRTKKAGEGYFRGLDEAVAASLEKDFIRALLDHPLLREEKQWLESEEARRIIRGIAEEVEIPESEIFWVSREKDKRGYLVKIFDYYDQRRVLDYVIDKIEDRNPEMSREQIWGKFVQGLFTGDLLTIGKLVEGAFGKGSFRLLGEVGRDKESALRVMAGLKKRHLNISGLRENKNL